MPTTTTKKELIERIAVQTGQRRTAVRQSLQCFFQNVIEELRAGNRLELRDFGVFETRDRQPRIAKNPRTRQQMSLPSRKSVRFKCGRLMKEALAGNPDPSFTLNGHTKES